MTQNEEIVQYMKQYGSITPMDAVADLGCYRLSARIHDIEHKMGLKVARKDETAKNRKGNTVVYRRYWLEEK